MPVLTVNRLPTKPVGNSWGVCRYPTSLRARVSDGSFISPRFAGVAPEVVRGHPLCCLMLGPPEGVYSHKAVRVDKRSV